MEHSTPIRSLAPTNNNNNNNNNDNDNQHRSMGLDELDSIDVESLRLVFGSEDLNKRKPHELRQLWMEKQKNAKTTRMPRFLLDPKNKDHVAPHAFALQLLLRRKGGKSDGDGLYKRVARSEHDENQNNYNNNNNNNNDTSNRYAESRNSNSNRTKDHDKEALGIILHLILVLLAVVVLVCQFTLEVLGGAGAIWGCAEIARLRKGGPVDPSWDFFTWLALGVGICCLGRFLLVHPFFPSSTDKSFFQKYKFQRSFLQLAKAVASDPVLFLHPTKGLGWCGCYCVCQRSSLDEEGCIPSPASLGKVSPQRSTWDLSDDESDDLQLREFDASP